MLVADGLGKGILFYCPKNRYLDASRLSVIDHAVAVLESAWARLNYCKVILLSFVLGMFKLH